MIDKADRGRPEVLRRQHRSALLGRRIQGSSWAGVDVGWPMAGSWDSGVAPVVTPPAGGSGSAAGWPIRRGDLAAGGGRRQYDPADRKTQLITPRSVGRVRGARCGRDGSNHLD